MIVQKLSDGTYRIKDITHRQYLKQKGYSDKEIKEIEKKDIAAGKARPGDMDKPMKGAPDVTRMFKKDNIGGDLTLNQKMTINKMFGKNYKIIKEKGSFVVVQDPKGNHFRIESSGKWSKTLSV